MSTLPSEEPHVSETFDETVELVIEGRPRQVGTLTVARLLPSAKRRLIGPFVFLDHLGPVTIAPGLGFDLKPHPHIGLSTVTYFLAGENVHRDSLGNVQVNRPGEVNLMTAGRGVVHSERADPGWRERGGHLHGLQIWLALPEEREEDAPSFEHHPQASLPEAAPAAGARGRVLLGTAFGAASPIAHPSRPSLIDLQLEADAALDVPAEEPERGVYVVEGAVRLGRTVLEANRLAVLRPGAAAQLRAREKSRVLLLGGPPVGRRYIDWNFVSSSQERIQQARRDWREQKFPKIPGDEVEFVPLPEWPRDAPSRRNR